VKRYFASIIRTGALAVLTLALAACTVGGGGGQQAPTPTSTNPPISTPTAATPAESPVSSNDPTPSVDPTPTLEGPIETGTAYVDSVELLILESFPVQVNAVVKGNLADPCTRIEEVKQERTGNTINVTITTARARGQSCIQVIEPFERTIPIDVVGLQAGTYTVNVEGVTQQLTLDVDNVMR
jgi:hypothetical protein